MSQQNVEVVRALFEAWNAGDWAAYRELLDPAVIVHAPERWPEPGPFVGREAALRQFKLQRAALDYDTADPTSDFLAVGDRVVVRFAWGGGGQGPDVRMEITGLYTVRKGRNVTQEFFWDHAEALEAVGLSE
jgi:ketosteroid isomerase-like protein